MTKQYFIYGAVAVVLIGAGIFILTGAYHGGAGTQTPIRASGSMADIIARGGSWKCEVSHKGPHDSTAGMVYVSDGKVRGDFESTVSQIGKMEMHMISDRSYAYTWTSLVKTGMKTKITLPAATTTASVDKSDMYHQQYDYQCSDWTPDATFFNLPADITFSEMGIAPSTSASAARPAGAPSCKMCDSVPAGTARTQCQAALCK